MRQFSLGPTAWGIVIGAVAIAVTMFVAGFIFGYFCT
jgi:hypothetical protein